MIELQGAWGQALISEVGACVLSWQPDWCGEQLFLSEDALIEAGTRWHGGIPICAPWFGAGQGDWDVPHGHGLVSRVPWRVESIAEGDAMALVRLTTSAASPGVDENPITLGAHIDRVYDAAPPTVLAGGTREVRLEGDGADSVIVWNPSPGGSQVGDGWAEFACVEYGNVQSRAVTIPAGGSHTLTLTISPA